MKVFNTLSGQKEEFLPQGDEVRMYVCGVTPYSDAHIGHAMSYIIFDAIRRYLQFRGFKVKYVQNITDIDDKIIDRANQRGIPIHELVEEYTASFFEDIDALNIGRADIYPRATKEIPKIIEVIQGLIDKGYAYPARGSVYFRVRSVADYGKLSHRNLESMMAGARIEAGEEKEYPMDFVMWKASKPGEPSWESPWGKGRPGWHIECSAMSLRYLGDTIDIHGGGQDLIFPHHENEIAQSESFTGKKPFVKYWLHNGLLQLGEEKMSKSLGNLITIKEALQKYSADAIRIFALSSHYRSPLTYSKDALEAAARGAERLRQAADEKRAEQYEKVNTEEIEVFISPDDFREKFISAMNDDFGTPRALSWLFTLASEINRGVNLGLNSEVVEHRKLLKELAVVLGLTLKLAEEPYITVELANNLVITSEENVELAKRSQRIRGQVLQNMIDDLITTTGYLAEQIKATQVEPIIFSNAVASNIGANISLREQFRQVKQFQLADEIRAKLDELDIVLEDTPKGTVWKRKR